MESDPQALNMDPVALEKFLAYLETEKAKFALFGGKGPVEPDTIPLPP
jgi:hypothetical protein